VSLSGSCVGVASNLTGFGDASNFVIMFRCCVLDSSDHERLILSMRKSAISEEASEPVDPDVRDASMLKENRLLRGFVKSTSSVRNVYDAFVTVDFSVNFCVFSVWTVHKQVVRMLD